MKNIKNGKKQKNLIYKMKNLKTYKQLFESDIFEDFESAEREITNSEIEEKFNSLKPCIETKYGQMLKELVSYFTPLTNDIMNPFEDNLRCETYKNARVVVDETEVNIYQIENSIYRHGDKYEIITTSMFDFEEEKGGVISITLNGNDLIDQPTLNDFIEILERYRDIIDLDFIVPDIEQPGLDQTIYEIDDLKTYWQRRKAKEFNL